jgi:hypothetical protein
MDSPIVPAAFSIGKDVLELIDNVSEIADTDEVDELNAIRDELEPKVLAHVDATEKALRGS